MSDDTLGTIGGFLIGLYVLSSQVMTAVFFIGFCKSWDSIIKIILLGPLLAELEGLLWPFFI